MIKIFFLSLFMLTSVFSKTCYEKFSKTMKRYHSCQLNYFDGNNCSMDFDNDIRSLKSFKALLTSFILQDFFEQNLSSKFYFNYEELLVEELQTDEIKGYIKHYKQSIKEQFYNSDLYSETYLARKSVLHNFQYKSSYITDLHDKIKAYYNIYFKKYLKRIQGVHDWDKIELIKKGISFGDIVRSISRINKNCSVQGKALSAKSSSSEFAKAILETHFLYMSESKPGNNDGLFVNDDGSVSITNPAFLFMGRKYLVSWGSRGNICSVYGYGKLISARYSYRYKNVNFAIISKEKKIDGFERENGAFLESAVCETIPRRKNDIRRYLREDYELLDGSVLIKKPHFKFNGQKLPFALLDRDQPEKVESICRFFGLGEVVTFAQTRNLGKSTGSIVLDKNGTFAKAYDSSDEILDYIICKKASSQSF